MVFETVRHTPRNGTIFAPMNGPTADIQVGAFIRQWVISNTGSDTVRLDKRTNLWGIIKENLELVPPDWHPLQDRGEYISVEILDCGSAPCYNRDADRKMYVNELFRCYLGEETQAVIRRYLENQFRNAFRIFMTSRYADESKEKIRHAISSFLLEYDLPINATIISRLSKDWYRWRVKHPDKSPIPIFF